MKVCPYCWENIQNTAKKCRYCWERLNNEVEKDSIERTENKKKNKTVMLIIILVLIWIIVWYILFNTSNKKETWQWFYYEDELKDWKEIWWPIFANYDACKDWAIDKFLKWQEAFCSYNCHDSIDWTPICEKAVRTRHPLPWFWEVFEWVDEIRNHKESAIKNNEEIVEENSKNNIWNVPYIDKWTQIRWDFDWDWVYENARTYFDVNREREEWTCYIQFELNKFPKITIENCIWGDIVNEGDLDDNWTHEIWISPSWFTSCWWWYLVRTYKNWKWDYLISPITTHCNQQDECYYETNYDCDRISAYWKWKVRTYSSKLTDDYDIIWEYKVINL